MVSRGMTKTAISALVTCGLTLGIAAGAGAQVHTDSDGYRWHTDESTGKIRHCAHYGPNGDLYYLGKPRRDLDPSYLCPGEINPTAAEPEKRGVGEAIKGFWDKGKEQIDKGKERVNEIKDAFNLESLKEKFSAHEQPWCHEVRPGTNCIEYLPPAVSASGAGGGTTINVHSPTTAETDPFDSVYDNYQAPAASRYGKVIGRAVKQKAERDRRKAEHRRLLSTLDRHEGRTGGPKAKSDYRAAVGEQTKSPARSVPTWRKPPVQVIKPTKNYAVKPTDYSRPRAKPNNRPCPYGAGIGGMICAMGMY